ncbi:MAG: Gfo/Idh/MocA family protein [Tangfeifania sp.]
MKTNRRKFFQIAGVAGAGMLSGGLASCSRERNGSSESALSTIKESVKQSHPQQFNMSGYAAPKLETVRIGFIGLGNRGPGAVERMSNIEGVKITALCDINPAGVERAQQILEKHDLPKAKEYSGSEDAWKELCESPDVDLVYIATPWDLHTPMCVYTMENGKHAATEVPAAVTVEEAWQLVETSERTKMHCMMLENCCYDFFELLTLNMARQGFFGEIVHTEGAYIHDLLQNNFGKGSYADMWRLKENQKRNGSLYPTHGLGPVCQILNVNRGDKMDYLTSMSTDDFQMGKMAAELAAEDGFYEQFNTDSYRGNMNTTTIRTTKGKTIMIQHDVTSPRPYSRIHLVSGTDGIARKYPLPAKIAKGHAWLDEDEMKVLEEKYTPEIVKLVGDMAKKVGGHGGMDFMMDWRLIDCLRNGIPLDQDVYDAASWSVIAPLSEWSVANRSNSIDVPDFTNGAWQTNEPVDIELVKGGTTGVRITAEVESQMDV